MQQMFSGDLVACIRDGRPPEPEEVATMSSKLWDEAISYRMSPRTVAAEVLARVALCGCGSVPRNGEWHENE